MKELNLQIAQKILKFFHESSEIVIWQHAAPTRPDSQRMHVSSNYYGTNRSERRRAPLRPGQDAEEPGLPAGPGGGGGHPDGQQVPDDQHAPGSAGKFEKKNQLAWLIKERKKKTH